MTPAGGASPIRTGLIGVSRGTSFRDAGWAYVAHLPALHALPEYRLGAISSRSAASAETVAPEFGIETVHRSTEALVQDPTLDLVVVTVRVPAHFAIIEAALRAGKAVFSEWPLARDAAEAACLADLARLTGRRCGVCLQGRASPVVRYVRDLVRTGWIGEVLSTSMIGSGMNWGPGMPARNDYTLSAESGATLSRIAVGHALDTLQFVLGPIREGNAMSALRRPEVQLDDGVIAPATADDQWMIAARLAGGAAASVHFRGGQARGDNLLWTINGTEGDLVVTSEFGNIQPFPLRLAGGRGTDGLAAMPVPDRYRFAGPLPDPAFNVAQLYTLFAADLRDGTRECADFDDALRLHALLEALERSAATGRRVRLEAGEWTNV